MSRRKKDGLQFVHRRPSFYNCANLNPVLIKPLSYIQIQKCCFFFSFCFCFLTPGAQEKLIGEAFYRNGYVFVTPCRFYCRA